MIAKVPFSVTDPHNRFVTGLEIEHFRLVENGVERQIVAFSPSGRPMSAVIGVHVRSGERLTRAMAVAEDISARLRDGGSTVEVVQGPVVEALTRLNAGSHARRVAVLITEGALPADPVTGRGIEVYTLDALDENLQTTARTVAVQLNNEYFLTYVPGRPESATPSLEIQIRQPIGLPTLKVWLSAAKR